MSASHILVVDDEPDIRNLVQEILSDEGYEVDVAADASSARESRRLRRPDLVLLDIWMPGEDGITLLKEWQDGGVLSCPVIIMSGHGTVETAVEATRLGAYDFIEKPLTLAKLLLSVRRALESDQQQRDHAQLGDQSYLSEPIGSSIMMQQLRAQSRRIAQHDSWVLIAGEPGVGKETIARYIHSLSPRSDQPFIASAAAALESATDLLGAETEGVIHPGLLEQAGGGVFFLDEVGDLELEVQGRLLNVLEGQSFTRPGGSQPVSVDVRVMAASQRDLQAEVRAERMREDLYYRLNVVPLRVPALREHAEDIPELLNYYVDFYCGREGLPYRRFAIAAQNRLRHYSWPGNTRELRNLVQRLLIMGTSEQIIASEVELALGQQTEKNQDEPQWQQNVFELPLREAREEFERSYLLHQLKQCRGSVSRLSQRVGMERTHLYRKLRALGINPKEVD
ncbi:MAG: sigma-54-dependent Fis family transcriptional regulator [Gammaproteobacteria bacterium]|nr:sigma-54-dependent Fis family transcriptional regulator [Gammaproteobacteria bacterium]